MFQLFFRSLLCLLVLVCSSSCGTKSLFDSLAKNRKALGEETLWNSQNPGKEITMDWETALERLLKYNISIKRSEQRVEESLRRKRGRWKTYLPKPVANIALQGSLFNLGDITSDDLSATVFAPLRIPNPVTERARTFQLALQEVQSRDALILSKRRQIIRLYQLFTRWEQAERTEAEKKRSLAKGIEAQIQEKLQSLRSNLGSTNEFEGIQTQLVDMLNMPGFNIILKPQSLPEVDYSKRFKALVPSQNYGKLALRLSSYEIEAALLREKGIQFNSWPRVSASASTPPIYDRRTGGDFDTDQIQLFGTLTKTFDMSGDEAATLESAEENVKFVRQQLKIRLDREGRQWRALQNRYKLLLQRRAFLKRRFRTIQNYDVPAGAALSQWESLRQIKEELESLELTQERIDMEIWIWDDSKWKGYSL